MTSFQVLYFAMNFDNASNEGGEGGEVCIPNISSKERRKRAKFAIWQFIASLVVLGAVVALEVNPLWRLPLFFMFSAAATSYFQARDKT